MPEINFLENQKKKTGKKSKKGTPKIEWSDPKADERDLKREKTVRNFFGLFFRDKNGRKAQTDNVDIKAARKEVLKTIKEAEEAEAVKYKSSSASLPLAKFGKSGKGKRAKKSISRSRSIFSLFRAGRNKATPLRSETGKSIVGEPSSRFSGHGQEINSPKAEAGPSKSDAGKRGKSKKEKKQKKTKMSFWRRSFFSRPRSGGVEVDYKKAYKEKKDSKLRHSATPFRLGILISQSAGKNKKNNKKKKTAKRTKEREGKKRKIKVFSRWKSFFSRPRSGGVEIDYKKAYKEKDALIKPPPPDFGGSSRIKLEEKAGYDKKKKEKKEKQDSIYFIINKYINSPKRRAPEPPETGKKTRHLDKLSAGKPESQKANIKVFSWWKNFFSQKRDKDRNDHQEAIKGKGIDFKKDEVKKETKDTYSVAPVPEPPARSRHKKKKIKKPKAEKKIKYKIWENLDVLKTNLIKDEFILLFGWQKKAAALSLIVSFSFIIIWIAYGGLVLWERRVADADRDQIGKIEELDAKIEKAEAEVDEIIVFQKKLRMVSRLLDNHVYWTNFFKFLEDRTLANIYYTGGFAGDTGGSYSFPAIAEDFKNIAQQIQIMEKDDYVEEARTTGGTVAPTGGVSFNLSLILNPDIFYKPFQGGEQTN